MTIRPDEPLDDFLAAARDEVRQRRAVEAKARSEAQMRAVELSRLADFVNSELQRLADEATSLIQGAGILAAPAPSELGRFQIGMGWPITHRLYDIGCGGTLWLSQQSRWWDIYSKDGIESAGGLRPYCQSSGILLNYTTSGRFCTTFEAVEALSIIKRSVARFIAGHEMCVDPKG